MPVDRIENNTNPHEIHNNTLLTNSNNETIMMQPSSIFEAIKNDDFEGLISLYATTVYDSVHSAEFAARICGSYDGVADKDMSSILMPPLQGGRGDSDGSSRDDVEMFLDGEFQLSLLICT